MSLIVSLLCLALLAWDVYTIMTTNDPQKRKAALILLGILVVCPSIILCGSFAVLAIGVKKTQEPPYSQDPFTNPS